MAATYSVNSSIHEMLMHREIAGKQDIVQNFNCNFKNDLCQKDVREHFSCINALQFSHDERLLSSGGDDTRVRVWNVDEMIMRKEPKPIGIMDRMHGSNIFSVEFDLEDKMIYSGERNGRVFKHNIETKQIIFETDDGYDGDVYQIHQNPSNNNIVVVTRCNKITLMDDRVLANPQVLRLHDDSYYYSAEFHPTVPRLLLVNSRRNGPSVYDMRMVRHSPLFDRAIFNGNVDGGKWMGSTWSPSGNRFMAIRNHKSPVFFDLISHNCLTLESDTYLNKKTIKSITFIDEFTVATGSDRCDIHIWKVPPPEKTGRFPKNTAPEDIDLKVPEYAVLKGHRSIPNQLRFSKQNQILVSSGVEKIIKLWSDRRLPWSYDVPFVRGRTRDISRDEEFRREKTERKELEEGWDRDGLMEGRASWDDVFGGDVETAEDRETLEQFDVRFHRFGPNFAEHVRRVGPNVRRYLEVPIRMHNQRAEYANILVDDQWNLDNDIEVESSESDDSDDERQVGGPFGGPLWVGDALRILRRQFHDDEEEHENAVRIVHIEAPEEDAEESDDENEAEEEGVEMNDDDQESDDDVVLVDVRLPGDGDDDDEDEEEGNDEGVEIDLPVDSSDDDVNSEESGEEEDDE